MATTMAMLCLLLDISVEIFKYKLNNKYIFYVVMTQYSVHDGQT